jgi:hypothetical protein
MRRIVLLAAIALAFVGARTRSVRPPAPPLFVDGPTYSNEIVRIFQDRCQTCHHEGDIAPFSLTNYADAKAHATMIKVMTQTRQMPPWKPTPGCGDFADARVLPQSDIDLIAKWVSNGAPEGDPSKLPAPLDFSGGWPLGQPDLVLSDPEAFTPPATRDEYRCFTLPTQLTSDKYVSAIDVRPGDRQVVHHVIAFIDATGESQRLDDADPAPGYQCFGGPGFSITNLTSSTLGGWAPGARAARLPENIAYSLPANSRIVLQVHYHLHDTEPHSDRTELAVYYAKRKPEKTILVLPLINQNFTLAPNDPNAKVTASFTNFLTPVHIWFIAPHMHLLGRKMKVEETYPNGSKSCLVNIDDWSFNWQGQYYYKEPIAAPVGANFALTAFYDNSVDNPLNPNYPPKAVSWGEQTTDEMCIAFLGVTVDSQQIQ